MKTKEKKNWKLILAERNLVFQKLSPQEQRIAIAKDVLRMINTKQINANAGVYVGIDYDSKCSYEGDLAIALDSGLKGCNCCALGSMLLAHVYHTDNFSVGESVESDRDIITDNLDGIFDKEQLGQIESAFELDANYYFYATGNSAGDAEGAVSFGQQFATDRKRLIAIMENIIANGGTFIP